MKTIIKATTSPEEQAFELHNRELSRKAARESFVLLENNGVLPLREKKIALYGSGARMTIVGGTGSGQVRNRYSVSIYEGLKNAGFEITTESWLDRFDRYYADTYEAYRLEQEEKVAGIREFYRILGMITPFQQPYGIPIEEEDVVGHDTAVYVIARQAGEGNDRENSKGDYRLTDLELENLRFAAGHYNDLIVVLNVGGLIDLSFMDEIKISALVVYSQGGEEGGNALADLFSGAYNFSGKLADSWPYRFEDVPSSRNYSGMSPDPFRQDYLEGGFVGYRYFDTFGVRPRYAFGTGLSYTEFEIAARGTSVSRDSVTVTVNVRNTGSSAGREVVQLYASVPYDTHTEAKRLVAFAKTGKLNPSEEQQLELNCSFEDLAVYDEDNAAWVLRDGEYILCLGNASDRTAPVAVLQSERHVLEKCRNITECRLHEELTAPERQPCTVEGLERLSLDGWIGETKVNTYEKEMLSDSVVEEMDRQQLVELVIGAGNHTEGLQVTAMGASGSSTQNLYESLGIPNIVLSDGPQGLNLTSQSVELEDGRVKAARVPHVLEAYKRYLFGFSGMALKSQMADPSEGVSHYQYATAWPCEHLLAQSFDTCLLEEIGDGIGMEMEEFGVTIWLGPAVNLHRNPLGGRTFEYYSEDPILSGKLGAAVIRGVQKHTGRGVSLKHYVANDCELNRNMSSSNLSERVLREVYLKPFEIAVKESSPMTVMAAYNMVNGVYCTNHTGLLTDVLRGEWDYRGMVVSDWDSMKASREDCEIPASADVQKAAASGLDLVMPGRQDQKEALLKGLDNGKVRLEDVKNSAVRVLRTVRQNTELESR